MLCIIITIAIYFIVNMYNYYTDHWIYQWYDRPCAINLCLLHWKVKSNLLALKFYGLIRSFKTPLFPVVPLYNLFSILLIIKKISEQSVSAYSEMSFSVPCNC